MIQSQSAQLTGKETEHITICDNCGMALHIIKDCICPACGSWIRIPDRIRRRIKRDMEEKT